MVWPLADDALLAPLEVNRAAVWLHECEGLGGEGFDFGVGQREAVALLWRDVGEFDGLADRLVGRIDQLLGFLAEAALEDCRFLGANVWLVDVKLVGIDRTLHDRLAKRSEERRVGKEGVSTCRSRWPPYH